MQYCESRYRHDQAGHRHLLQRAAAFAAQGVLLKDDERSWSGARRDGSIVFGIHADLVHENDDGFSCRLSRAPEPAARHQAQPQAIDLFALERLEHCRIALRQGGADGLLTSETGLVRGNSVLSLRMVRRRDGYWGVWGTAVRSARPGTVELASRPAEAA